MALTPREIEDRFEEAAITLRRLPNPKGSGPRGYGRSWPDYVQEAQHAYGYHEVRIRIVPTAAEIQRMDECIDWLRWLDPDDAKIVWLRAEGERWRQVCIHAGCVRQTAWRRWAAALLTVAKHLTANEKPKTKRVATAYVEHAALTARPQPMADARREAANHVENTARYGGAPAITARKVLRQSLAYATAALGTGTYRLPIPTPGRPPPPGSVPHVWLVNSAVGGARHGGLDRLLRLDVQRACR